MQQTRLLYSIAFTVFAIHAGLILFLFITFQTIALVKPPAQKKLVVKTISLRPEVIKPAPIQSPPPPPAKPPVAKAEPPKPQPLPKPDPKPKPEPIQKPAPKPKLASKPKPEPKPKLDPKPKPKPAPKKSDPPPPPPAPPKAKAAADNKKKELIAKAQESIAKISKRSDNINAPASKLTVPVLNQTLQLEGLTETETGYRDELAGRLKMLLRLPEYGSVKIKLTLNRQGKFVKMEVVDSENQANRSYIEKKVPELLFPSFGENFKGKAEYTFSITLKS